MTANSQNGKNVKVTITTTINHQGEPETFELTTFGKLMMKNSANFLTYDEVLEDLTVHTTVKISDERLLIMRSGDLSMRMVFQENSKNKGEYVNPLGNIPIETDTKYLRHKIQPTEGFIEVAYNLYTQRNLLGTYDLKIKYEEEKR